MVKKQLCSSVDEAGEQSCKTRPARHSGSRSCRHTDQAEKGFFVLFPPHYTLYDESNIISLCLMIHFICLLIFFSSSVYIIICKMLKKTFGFVLYI